MRKIRRRRRNYTNYIIIACICVFSVMGIGYGYLQESLDINMGLSKKAIDITDNVVSSGDGLYVDQYETGRYVYRGSEPNNYIKFNDELWRIIAKESDGTYKIIRDEWLPDRAFDAANHRLTTNNTYCNTPSLRCNVYGKVSGTYTLGNISGTVTEDSSLAEYLNGEYYNSLTPIAKGQIQTHAFNIGGVLDLEVDGNDSIAKNLQQEKAYPWTGNIGLPNVTDILRASLNPSCTSATDVYGPSNANKCTTNYLTDNLTTSYDFYLLINGYTDVRYVWRVSYYNNMLYLYTATASYSMDYVLPVLFLKSNIHIISGDGSETNPYIID